MPANGRRDLIRRLKVKDIFTLAETLYTSVVGYSTCRVFQHHQCLTLPTQYVRLLLANIGVTTGYYPKQRIPGALYIGGLPGLLICYSH